MLVDSPSVLGDLDFALLVAVVMEVSARIGYGWCVDVLVGLRAM
jgi:hypothetical protein